MYGLDGVEDAVDLDETIAGAEIGAAIKKKARKLCKYIDRDLFDMHDAVAKIVRGTTGIRDAALAPSQVIELQVEQLVIARRKQCEDIVNHINQMLVNYVREVAEKTLSAYPRVKERALDLVEGVVEENRVKTIAAINIYLDAEKCGVNTDHPRFEMIRKNKLDEQAAINVGNYATNGVANCAIVAKEEEESVGKDDEEDQIQYFMLVVKVITATASQIIHAVLQYIPLQKGQGIFQ